MSDEEQIRTDHYYGGDLVLRPVDYRTAELVWMAYQGGSIIIALDWEELERLQRACEKVRSKILAEQPWLDS